MKNNTLIWENKQTKNTIKEKKKRTHGDTFCSSNVWNVSSGFSVVKRSKPALPRRVTWVSAQCLFFFIQSHFYKHSQKTFTSISAVQEVQLLKQFIFPQLDVTNLFLSLWMTRSLFIVGFVPAKQTYYPTLKCFLSQYYCTAKSEHENIYWKFAVWEVSDIWKMKSKGLGAGWRGGQG